MFKLIKNNIEYKMSKNNIMNLKIGENINLHGWVHNKRDHGGLLFIEIRTYKEIIQLVWSTPHIEVHKEDFIEVIGISQKREGTSKNNYKFYEYINEIEIEVKQLRIISKSALPPFNINDNIGDDLKLEYRFLYLRSDRMKSNIFKRAAVVKCLRNFFEQEGFLEITTPLLTASTPEGARDFVVPSRLHKKKYYALPQSPQIFKQLLMVSGFEKYCQYAPCFRDEDLRHDRNVTFYQWDFEMSNATSQEVLELLRRAIFCILETLDNKPIEVCRMTYNEALEKYGTDKPDLRNSLIIEDWTNHFQNSEMTLFRNLVAKGCVVKVIKCVHSHHEKTLLWAKENGFIVAYAEKENGIMKGPISKFCPDLFDHSVFLICDYKDNALKNAGKLRKYLGENLRDIYSVVEIVDFPMFEFNEGKWDFMHNPFSMPNVLLSDNLNLETVTANQYDLVLNGYELASGSVRQHDWSQLLKAFQLCSYEEKDIKNKFRCMYSAFNYGVPPHAGAAMGIERIVMILQNEENVREVTAFPLNTHGLDPLTGAPSELTNIQKKELGIL